LGEVKAQVLDGISPSAMLKLHSDSLRGSIGPARAWWNATFYDVTVKPDLSARSIQGTTIIAFVEDPDGYKIELIERK
jgi:catechol 2,3-dioxygenase-like lactoylglutathione lyase family enzyme